MARNALNAAPPIEPTSITRLRFTPPPSRRCHVDTTSDPPTSNAMRTTTGRLDDGHRREVKGQFRRQLRGTTRRGSRARARDAPPGCGARIQEPYQCFGCDLSVAALNQRGDPFLIRRDVDPSTDPHASAVGRREKMPLACETPGLSRRQAKRDRWTALKSLECTERFVAGVKRRMTPRRGFLGLRQRQAHPSQSCEHRPFKLSRSHGCGVSRLSCRAAWGRTRGALPPHRNRSVSNAR